MNNTAISFSNNTANIVGEEVPASYIDQLLDRYEEILQQHRAENPDLYRLVELRKKQAINDDGPSEDNVSNITDEEEKPLWPMELRGELLRAQIRASHGKIHQHILALNADITPRTQAHNRKCDYQSIDEEREFRAEALGAQIKAWRSMLPTLIRRFSHIPDYRRANSIKHKITVLMIFGLFAFIFRLSSRREMNRELTSPIIFDHLKRVFPEIDSIPHADTLARALEHIDPRKIESIHISMINELIKKKKFRKLLIQDCLPITIDGAQKLYRQGLLQDSKWCERKVGNDIQQYLYTLEANITLKNGLTIPLMTEYLYRSTNELEQDTTKQDSEITAFTRLAERLKKYFPRLKIIVFTDAMFAAQAIMEKLYSYQWAYIIRLPKKKLMNFSKQLSKNKQLRISLPDQDYYRKRKQSFYWENDIPYGSSLQLNINLIACFEEYKTVNSKTGKIEKCFSEHAWISSIPAKVSNLHDLLNLGARKKELIEDSFNTEKNRGYHYKHAFSYNWNACQGFHCLMRLAHAINAISEFTKKLKKYVKELGCSATLKLIKETLFSPWLSLAWYKTQLLKTPQLRLQLE
jgi:hypothetical protein